MKRHCPGCSRERDMKNGRAVPIKLGASGECAACDCATAETVYTHTRSRRIAGYKITLRAGLRYVASRPFAARGRKAYPVTIQPVLGAPMDTPSVTIPGLSYAKANALVNAFNNGAMSFDGRVW